MDDIYSSGATASRGKAYFDAVKIIKLTKFIGGFMELLQWRV
jgi:hypothetical protein